MQLNLPEPLKSETQALAQQKGVTVETIVVQAVEYYLKRKSDMKTRASEARQRLQALNRFKYEKNVDLAAEMRQIRQTTADLYLGQEEFDQIRLLQVAEKPTNYNPDIDKPDETLS